MCCRAFLTCCFPTPLPHQVLPSNFRGTHPYFSKARIKSTRLFLVSFFAINRHYFRPLFYTPIRPTRLSASPMRPQEELFSLTFDQEGDPSSLVNLLAGLSQPQAPLFLTFNTVRYNGSILFSYLPVLPWPLFWTSSQSPCLANDADPLITRALVCFF